MFFLFCFFVFCFLFFFSFTKSYKGVLKMFLFEMCKIFQSFVINFKLGESNVYFVQGMSIFWFIIKRDGCNFCAGNSDKIVLPRY